MKNLFLFASTAFLLLAAAVPSHAEELNPVGLRTISAEVPERGAAIDLGLWYPAGPDGEAEVFGASAIFEGVSVQRDASMAEGQFPLVVLSHGGLRSNPALSGWIAASLAARGHMVLTAQPPQLGGGDALAATREVWLRPADLTAALNVIEADPDLLAHRSGDGAAALGFFLGGTSVLGLAGGRLDAKSYRASCDPPKSGPDCRWFAANGVDLHQVTDEVVSKSRLDPRIRVAIAVNPELGASFTAESLNAIKVPVQVIALGAADPDLAGLRDQIPGVQVAEIPDAAPFSAFSRCTAKAAVILAEEGEDDTICRDGGQRSRAEIQDELGRIITTAIADALRGQP